MTTQHSMFLHLLIASLCLVGLTACGGTTYFPVAGTQYPPRPTDCQIDVYTENDAISKPYLVIGDLYAETGRTLFNRHSPQAAMDRLRAKACASGADAVIVQGIDHTGAVAHFAAGYGYSTVQGKALRYER